MTIHSKPISAIDESDLSELIDSGEPESYHLEYKSGMILDSWFEPNGTVKPKDEGKIKILREIVAFANAGGGTLVIGMNESKTIPHIAERISEFDHYDDIAERIRRIARSKIAPQLPLLLVRGIGVGTESKGIVVCRISESRLAPHRLESKEHQCLVRRADESVSMTMEEIQEMVIYRQLLGSRIEQSFEQLKEPNLHEAVSRLADGNGKDVNLSGVAYAIQVSAVPTAGAYSVVDLEQEIEPRGGPFSGTIDNIRINFDFPGMAHLATADRPLLRGFQWEFKENFTVIAKETGEVRYLLLQKIPDGMSRVIYSTHVVSILANLLNLVSQIRQENDTPDSEYAMEIDIAFSREGGFDLSRLRGALAEVGEAGRLDQSLYSSPRYSLGGSDRFNEIIGAVMRDLFMACGCRYKGAVLIDAFNSQASTSA